MEIATSRRLDSKELGLNLTSNLVKRMMLVQRIAWMLITP
jgi:hypothetical protein